MVVYLCTATELSVITKGALRFCAYAQLLIVQKFMQTSLDGKAELDKIADATATVREYTKYFVSSIIGSQCLKECTQRVNQSPKKIPNSMEFSTAHVEGGRGASCSFGRILLAHPHRIRLSFS